MLVLKLKDNFYNSEIIKRKNTSDLFYYEGDIANMTTKEEKTFTEIAELVQHGKIAIFPISKKQSTDCITGHIQLGFKIYFMKYKDFLELKENYIKNCVEAVKVQTIKKTKQPELF